MPATKRALRGRRNNVRLWMIRRAYHFEPAMPEALAVLERIPQKKLIEVEAVQRRNARMNSLYWVLLHRVADWLSQDDVDADVLHEVFKLECGAVRLVKMANGEIHKVASSTAFDKMDQIAFAAFFEKAVRFTYERLQVPPALVADLLTPTLASEAA